MTSKVPILRPVLVIGKHPVFGNVCVLLPFHLTHDSKLCDQLLQRDMVDSYADYVERVYGCADKRSDWLACFMSQCKPDDFKVPHGWN